MLSLKRGVAENTTKHRGQLHGIEVLRESEVVLMQRMPHRSQSRRGKIRDQERTWLLRPPTKRRSETDEAVERNEQIHASLDAAL